MVAPTSGPFGDGEWDRGRALLGIESAHILSLLQTSEREDFVRLIARPSRRCLVGRKNRVNLRGRVIDMY